MSLQIIPKQSENNDYRSFNQSPLLLKLKEGQFTQLQVIERIKEIIFFESHVEVLTKKNHYIVIRQEHQNLPTFPNKETLEAYLKNVHLRITQFLNQDAYTLANFAKGFGGGNQPTKASRNQNIQLPLNQNTPQALEQFYRAIINFNVEQVESMLNAGFNPNAVEGINRTSMLSKAVNNPIKLDDSDRKPFSKYIDCDSIKLNPQNLERVQKKVRIIELLIDKGANVNEKLRGYHQDPVTKQSGYFHPIMSDVIAHIPPLFAANLVSKMLDKGADPSANDPHEPCSVFGQAVQRRQNECAKLLLERGADIGEASFYFYDILRQEMWEIFDLLLQLGGNINKTRPGAADSPLSKVSCGGEGDEKRRLIARKLIEAGVDVTGSKEISHVFHSMRHDQRWEEILLLMLERGANLDAAGSLIYSVLLYEQNNGYEFLLKHNATVHAKDSRTGLTGLQDICKNVANGIFNHYPPAKIRFIISELLKHGAKAKEIPIEDYKLLPADIQKLLQASSITQPELLKIAEDLSIKIFKRMQGATINGIVRAKKLEKLKEGVNEALLASNILPTFYNVEKDDEIIKYQKFIKCLAQMLDNLIANALIFDIETGVLDIEAINTSIQDEISVWKAKNQLHVKQEISEQNEIRSQQRFSEEQLRLQKADMQKKEQLAKESREQARQIFENQKRIEEENQKALQGLSDQVYSAKQKIDSLYYK